MRKVEPIQILLDEPIGGMTEGREDDFAGLGFGEYADVLAGVILGSASPFTMGVFGDWGTGKTTLMQMIRERLMEYIPRENPGDDGDPTIIPVWFDAWRYEREEDLIGPLLGAILDAAQQHAKHPNVAVISEALGTALRTLVSSVSVKLPVMEISGKEFVEQYDRFVDRLALPGSTEYRRAYRILQETIERFAVPADKTKPDNKFVVFVDDLDRCLPEAALQVLECTKVFLGFKGMVWVLGLKREIIENCIKERYRRKGDGDGKDEERHPYGEDLGAQYLQKIIQVPFTIPKGTADEMAQLPDHLAENEKLPKELYDEFSPVAEVDGEFDMRHVLPKLEKRYNVATHYLERKPRELKRLLNAYVVSSQITRKRFGDDADEKHQPTLTLALLVLRFLDENLYDHLTTEPNRERQNMILEEALRVLGREKDGTGPEETDTLSKRDEKERALWLTDADAEKIAKFLLATQLLGADPKDIEAHARATSATSAPEESPSDAGHWRLEDASDPDPNVRAALARRLGWSFNKLDAEGRGIVDRLAEDVPEVRAGLARGLGENYRYLDAEGRGIVDRLARDDSLEVRAALALRLGLNFNKLDAEGRGIVDRLAEDNAPEVRVRVASGLGWNYRHLDAEGRGIVDRLAYDDAPEVRAALAEGFGWNFEHRDAEGRGIVDRLAEDVPEVRAGLARGLGGNFGNLDAEGRGIVDRLAEDVPEVRAALALRLGRNYRYLDAEGRGIVDRLAEDEAPKVRAALAEGLGWNYRHLDAEGRGIVDRLAEDVPEVRAALALRLGLNFDNIDAEGRGIVDRLARDDSLEVRAALALRLGWNFNKLDAEGRGIVDRLAEDVPEVRAGLIQGLRRNHQWRGEEGDRLLEELLRRQAEEREEG